MSVSHAPLPASNEGRVAEGDLLWKPSTDRAAASRLNDYLRWLETKRGMRFSDYAALWKWSVTETDAFWMSLWDYFDVMSDARPPRAVSGKAMFGARWFEGARLNYAEHLLRHERSAPAGKTAIIHSSEVRPLAHLGWDELGAKVRAAATRLRQLGVQPGDRVVSYLPNLPETAIAMLATVAVGGVWSAVGPELGVSTVLDRFRQVDPCLILVADGYSFDGKRFDRRPEAAKIIEGLPTLHTVVWLDYVGLGSGTAPGLRNLNFDELVNCPAPGRDAFEFTRVPHDHPLWILYSSGTTGRPKAIVHGHAGMTLEHLKLLQLQMNFGPDTRSFFYTTTGWMMWNYVIASLIAGSTPVLFDGSPMHGGIDNLWKMADGADVTIFAVSPTLVETMRKLGYRPRDHFKLAHMDSIVVGGSPATPEVFDWLYREVKQDLWVASASGGTELCSAFVGSVPGQPVYAAEIQGRCLGMDVRAWSDERQELVDQTGELVVTKPFPSMPLRFWDDAENKRYAESYFETFPGVWRHGDLIKINGRGGCYIYGRSDATLNRFGVRIGPAEIYSIVNAVPGVADSLVVCCELPDGGYYMPMFVALKGSAALTAELTGQIQAALRSQGSPRHVPDVIVQAPAVPYTLTGKKMEVPIRRLFLGAAAESVATRDAMANPSVLDWYAEFAAKARATNFGRQQ